VIAPLVSLMKDQVEILSTLGINAAVIGAESFDEVNRDAKQGKFNILFASPEAILNSHFSTIIALKKKIGVVFIDEGHCIATWYVSEHLNDTNCCCDITTLQTLYYS